MKPATPATVPEIVARFALFRQCSMPSVSIAELLEFIPPDIFDGFIPDGAFTKLRMIKC
jgi:hypothetical protein